MLNMGRRTVETGCETVKVAHVDVRSVQARGGRGEGNINIAFWEVAMAEGSDTGRSSEVEHRGERHIVVPT